MSEPLEFLPSARRLFWRVLAIEASVSAVLNLVLGGLVTWTSFHQLARVPIWGRGGAMRDMLPSSFLPVFVMVLLLSFVIHKRRSTGGLDGAARWIEGKARGLSLLPSQMLLRALLLGSVAMTGMLLLSGGLTLIFPVQSLSFSVFMMLKLIQNVILGVLFAPIIVTRVLLEPVKTRAV